MGHAKVDTTLNVYTQVVEGSLRRSRRLGRIPKLFTIVHKPEKGAASLSLGTGSPSRSSQIGSKQQVVRSTRDLRRYGATAFALDHK